MLPVCQYRLFTSRNYFSGATETRRGNYGSIAMTLDMVTANRDGGDMTTEKHLETWTAGATTGPRNRGWRGVVRTIRTRASGRTYVVAETCPHSHRSRAAAIRCAAPYAARLSRGEGR